jgi:hypothetical protein
MILEEAPIGYRPAIGFQANRLLPPVDGPEYGMDMNRFPKDTPLTPNNATRFTREYERRAPAPTPIGAEDVENPKEDTPGQALRKDSLMANDLGPKLPAAPAVAVSA